ncbi:MAG: lipoprotein [Gammaproteobacteria bacterium]|nr:lipoprotein [Gammaproteobacteria bacterium]
MSYFCKTMFILSFMLLASCGQSGPLYLPKPAANHHVG